MEINSETERTWFVVEVVHDGVVLYDRACRWWKRSQDVMCAAVNFTERFPDTLMNVCKPLVYWRAFPPEFMEWADTLERAQCSSTMYVFELSQSAASTKSARLREFESRAKKIWKNCPFVFSGQLWERDYQATLRAKTFQDFEDITLRDEMRDLTDKWLRDMNTGYYLQTHSTVHVEFALRSLPAKDENADEDTVVIPPPANTPTSVINTLADTPAWWEGEFQDNTDAWWHTVSSPTAMPESIYTPLLTWNTVEDGAQPMSPLDLQEPL